MRKHIRCKSTGLFLTHEGQWTEDIQAAGDFHTARAVMEARERFSLRNCELCYFFGAHNEKSVYDFTVSLS